MATLTNKTTVCKPFRLFLLGDEISLNIKDSQSRKNTLRTAAQAVVWTWIFLSVGWLAMVAWVAIIEPMDEAVPWVYAMTAVVPPVSLLVVGAALTWTARALLRYLPRLA